MGERKTKEVGERRAKEGESVPVLQVDSRDFVHILKAHDLQVDSRDFVLHSSGRPSRRGGHIKIYCQLEQWRARPPSPQGLLGTGV